MKKIGIFLFIFANTFASQHGIKLGLNYTHDNQYNSSGNDYGYLVGWFECLNIAKTIRLQIEFDYAQKNVKSYEYLTDDEGVIIQKIDETFGFHFIEIPLLVKYQLPIFNCGSYIGPCLSFYQYSRVNKDPPITRSRNNYSYRIDNHSKNYSLIIGVDKPIQISNYFINLDCRYEFYINELLKAESKFDFQVLTFSIGILIL